MHPPLRNTSFLLGRLGDCTASVQGRPIASIRPIEGLDVRCFLKAVTVQKRGLCTLLFSEALPHDRLIECVLAEATNVVHFIVGSPVLFVLLTRAAKALPNCSSVRINPSQKARNRIRFSKE